MFDIELIKKSLIIFVLTLTVGFMGVFSYLKWQTERARKAYHFDQSTLDSYIQPETSYSPVALTSATPTPPIVSHLPTSKPTAPPQSVLPPKVYLHVPFLVQAPHANWDEIHKEACEEASLIMVLHHINKTPIESEDTGDREILDLVAKETEQGFGYDITISDVSTIANRVYGLKTARVVTSFNLTDLKRELAAGRPVIVPAAGRQLPNPYFRQPGPPYHMLVLKGYDEQGFITNDPGTRQGKDFRYTYDALYQAIHDWTGSTATITSGPKAYLVFD